MCFFLCAVLYLGVVKTNYLVQAYRKDESFNPSARAMSNPVKKLFNNINDTLKKLSSNTSVDNWVYSEVSVPPVYDYLDVWWTEHKTPTKEEITTIKLYHRDLNTTGLVTWYNNTFTLNTAHVDIRETLKPTIIKKNIKVMKRQRKIQRKKPRQRNGTRIVKMETKKTTQTTTAKTTSTVATTKEVIENKKLLYILSRDDTKGDLSIKANSTDISFDGKSHNGGIHASVISGLLFNNDTVISDFDYIFYNRDIKQGANISDKSYYEYDQDFNMTYDTVPIIIKVMKPEETALGLEKLKEGVHFLISPDTANMPKVDKEGIYRIEVTMKTEQQHDATTMNAGITERDGNFKHIYKNRIPAQVRQQFNGNAYPIDKGVGWYNNPYNQNFNPNINRNPSNQNTLNYKSQLKQIYTSNSNPDGMGFNTNAPFGKKHYMRDDDSNIPPNGNFNPNAYGPNMPSDSYKSSMGPNFNPNDYENPYDPNTPANFYKRPQGPNFPPNAYRRPHGPNFPRNVNRGAQGPNFNPNAYGSPLGSNFPPNGRSPQGSNFNPNAYGNSFGPNYPPNSRGPQGSNFNPNAYGNRFGPNFPQNGKSPQGPNYNPNAPIGHNHNPHANMGPQGLNSPANANISPHGPNSLPNFNNPNGNSNMKDNPFNQNYNRNPNGGISFNPNANMNNPSFNKDQKPNAMPTQLPDAGLERIQGNNTIIGKLLNENETKLARELEKTTSPTTKQSEPSKYPSPDPHIDPEAFLPQITEPVLWTPHTDPTTTKQTRSTTRSTIDMHWDELGSKERTRTTRAPKPTHPVFGTPPEKLSSYVHELIELMVELKVGYFTITVISLLDTMALKPKKDARVFFMTYEKEFDNMMKVDHMYYMGRNLVDVLQEFANYLSDNPVDEIQARAKMLHHMMLNRREVLSLDINSVIDYIDSLFIKEEGVKLFKVLEKIHDYPKGKPTARTLHRELTAALYHPLIRLHNTQKKEILLDSINKLIDNYKNAPPIGRRYHKQNSSNAARNKRTDDNINDMNQYAYYKERFKFYKMKLNLTKHPNKMEAHNLRTMFGFSTKQMERNYKTTKIRRVIVTKKRKRTTTAIKPTTSPTTPELTTTSKIPKKQQRFKIKNNHLIIRMDNATDQTATTEMLEAFEEAELTTTTTAKTEKENKEESYHKQKKILIKKKQLLRLKLKHPKLYKKYFKRKRKHKHKKDRKIDKKAKKLSRSKYKLKKLKKILHKYLSVEREYNSLMKKYTGKNKYFDNGNLQIPKVRHGGPTDSKPAHRYDNSLRNSLKTKKQITNSRPNNKQSTTSSTVQKWLPIDMDLQNGYVQNFTLNPIFDESPEINIDSADMMLFNKFENFQGVVPKSQKTTRKKLIPSSSYSDDEETLKISIYDAMKHKTEQLNARRRDVEIHKLVDKKTLNLLSSYSSEEVVLKSKLYKGFAFHNDNAQNHSNEEVISSNDEKFKADITRILSKRMNAKPFQEVSSYSDEEPIIRENLKL